MKNIIAFGASTSSKSINQKLATYAAQNSGLDYQVLHLMDYETAIYSTDREEEGFPKAIQDFADIIRSADGIIVSFAEHNGHLSAAFKNLYDWVSRYDRKIWQDKDVLLLATSPGPRGGKSVLGAMTTTFGFAGADIRATFSLPSFHTNFNDGISDQKLAQEFEDALKQLSTKAKKAA